MSFYTALTGLNAASKELSVTANNIANSSTTGFKKSTVSFGDIFASSPMQQGNTVVGQGVTVKDVNQQFTQGFIEFSSNALDLAITGEGFFPLRSEEGVQTYTRDGVFMLDNDNRVVNSSGLALQALPVDSVGRADFSREVGDLVIPKRTSGQAEATQNVSLALNLPGTATAPLAAFDINNPESFNASTATTVFDSLGNERTLSVYYRVSQAATADQGSIWQAYTYLDGQMVEGDGINNPTVLSFTTAGELIRSNVSDETNLSIASVSNDAVPGEYEITVQQLATSAKIKTDTLDSVNDITLPANTDLELTITINGVNNTITVPADSISEQSIVNAINEADLGLSAIVVNDPSGGFYFQIEGQQGASSSFSVTDNSTAVLNWGNPTGTDEEKNNSITVAQDAVYLVDGNVKTSSSNLVADAELGVSLELTSATALNNPVTLTLDNGSNVALGTTLGANLTLDLSNSVSAGSSFELNGQTVDGQAEGDLLGVDINETGLVYASYSNGSQVALGRVAIATFDRPTGLRQLGNSTFVATNDSGNARINEAGSAGFGTIRAGALERSNVDLTEELVSMINSQRKFQANAKAIETDSTLAQTIINLRS